MTMRRSLRSGLLCTVLLVASGAGGPVVAGAAAPSSASAAAGRALSSDLYDVAAVRGTGLYFAVGDSQDRQGGSLLFLRGRPGHWNPVAATVPAYSSLEAISAASAQAVWAVGLGSNPAGTVVLPLVMRLGRSGFRPVTIPRVAHGELFSVSAASARNVWAVGRIDPGFGRPRPLVLHWNGQSWRRLDPRLPRRFQSLSSVTVAGPSSVWMVGSYMGADPYSGRSELLHWNGHRWSAVTLPGARRFIEVSVSASGPRRALLAGSIDHSGLEVTYLADWNGRRWTRRTVPGHGSFTGQFHDVAVVGSVGWAVGDVITDQRRPVAARWDGSHWTLQSTAAHGRLSSLDAVAAGTAAHPVAVGSSTNARQGDNHALSEVYRGRWVEFATPESSPNH